MDGEPYLIIDENRVAVGIGPHGYSAFLKEGESGVDEKVAVTATGEPGYIFGTTGTDGVIRTAPSLTMQKDINDSYVQLAVADVDCGTF